MSASLQTQPQPIPEWFQFFLDRMNVTPASAGESMRVLLSPKPLQLFFAEYLQQDLPAIAEWYYLGRADGSDSQSGISQQLEHAVNEGTFLKTSPPKSVRESNVIAMSHRQFSDALPGMKNPYVRGTAAILQRGIDAYFEKMVGLVNEHSLNVHDGAMRGLWSGIDSQSIWGEFLPFLALSYVTAETRENPFRDAFEQARQNHAFVSGQGDTISARCPASSMIKHLLNTDLIEAEDGTLSIAAEPRTGALPAFIFARLEKQGARLDFPALGQPFAPEDPEVI